ncbi:hypothetical protein IQ243_24695 [Nostocales cyanobacterium LEGE 11386]|nr:hypothetical protein [Nostocales cyanobacterium LEGE 11386]
MITPSKLEKGITLLQTHFNRELCPQAIAIWSEYLNEHLDDETFTLAVKQAILSLDFFPNAKRLVEFATPSKEVQAIANWQNIIAAAKTSNEQWQQEILQSLAQQAHIALTAIGGLQTVALADEWQLNKLEKKFVTIYCESPSDVKFLPPTPTKSHKPHLTDFSPSEQEPIDLSTKTPQIRQILENLSLRSIGVEIPIQQVYANNFARYDWQIDDNRLHFFLNMDEDNKKEFLAKFHFAIKTKSNWHSPQSIFDEISSYKTPLPETDFKAVARQWLTEEQQQPPEHTFQNPHSLLQ